MKIKPFKDENGSEDDSFEHLSGDETSAINKFYRDLRKSSSAKQVTVGALSGWCAGFVFTKFGKTAATAIGGTMLLLHIAHYNGYIKVDWNRLNKDVAIAKKEFERRKHKELPQLMRRLQEFVRDNAVIAGGFGAGFLLGMASA